MDESSTRSGRAIFLSILVTGACSMCSAGPAASEQRFSILYHESIVPHARIYDDSREFQPGASESIRFDAFGRQFDIQLRARSRRLAENGQAGFDLFSGRLESAPNSWVRLMRRGDALSGVIYDGAETYIIEPRNMLAGALIESGAATNSASIIYRLADTLVPSGLLACETHPGREQIDGQRAASLLTAELAAVTPNTAAAEVPTATVGVVADIEFFDRFGPDSASEVESYFNIVEGFYSDQVGIQLSVTETMVVSGASQNPFTDTNVGSELLDEVGDWRRLNQRDLALTHLITDRPLTGQDPTNSIAGLSFFGVPGRAGVCFARSGAGISSWFGNLTALIIAHEIAHNFGAPHDGEPAADNEPPNPCESTPASGFIMSASLTSSATNEFSQCSLSEMQKVIDAGRLPHVGTRDNTRARAGHRGWRWRRVDRVAVSRVHDAGRDPASDRGTCMPRGNA